MTGPRDRVDTQLDAALSQAVSPAQTRAAIPSASQHTPAHADATVHMDPTASPAPPSWQPPRTFPCSSGQRRFWVLNQLDPGNPALNVAVRWRLEGHIESATLERAFQKVVERHEILRTMFAEIEGEPVQIALPQVTFRLLEIDLRHLPPGDALAESERAARLEARAAFDLQSHPPLLRATLIRLRPEVSVVLVTLHHIVSDGWSIGVLAEEIGEFCAAEQAGRLPNLPELPISYGEYSAWQNEWLETAPFTQAAETWREALRGMEQFEILPDHPRPPIQTANGAITSILLERSLSDGLVALAQRQACTLYMAALAGLLATLHRYSGETDIGIGTQLASRDQVELEGLVGLFINTLVLRTDVSGDPSFKELLTRVSNVVTNVFEYQQLPLEKIIEWVKPKRDRSRNALFSVNFVLQRTFIRNQSHARFKLIDMPSVSAGALYDLNFFMVERPDGWRFSCEYNTDLFDAITITRLLGHFENLVRSAVAEPTLRLSQLPMLSEPERAMVLSEWNQTTADFPSDLTVTTLFEQQVERTPDAIAVTCQGTSLSYRELNQAANQLAWELNHRGLGQCQRIGVFLNRSTELVVALLAILKTGGTYVAMDIHTPPERLQHIVSNAELSGMVSRANLESRIQSIGLPKLLLDQDAVRISGRPITAPQLASAAPPSATSLAYILYTSGSTGRPKGVLVPHRALVNLLWGVKKSPGICAEDTLVSVSSIAFDISGLEVFLPLISGAKLVLATEAQVQDGSALLEILNQHRATLMFATPITWQFLLTAGWNGQPRLKMMCGGETLPRKLADALLATGGELWNVYGPTETTIYASVSKVTTGSGAVPLGAPLPNVRFYVLDAYQQPVPVGVPGELYIGGEQVALGYAGLPELTKEKFLADPFDPRAGMRMYRTGDRVRWHHREHMEYLGRSDHQIKLRGFRIELGEIESVLTRHPDIAEAVAIVGQDNAGDPTLWAYAITNGEADMARSLDSESVAALTEQLRQRLRQELPAYMRPAAITLLDALPRTQNGKIDVRALPRPAETTQVESSSQNHLSPIEQKLANIWCSVLGVRKVEKHDNFFDLGGHSLLAARMLAKIESEFGQRLTLATLFKTENLEALANVLSQPHSRDFDFRQVVKLQPNGSRTPLLAINNTGIYYQLSKQLGSDQPFTSLQLFDPANPLVDLPATFEDVATAYVDLIRRVQPQGPYQLLGWCIAGALAYEIARQLVAAGESVEHLLLVDTYAPGYLRRMPTWKANLTEYLYRFKLIQQDWQRYRRGEQSLRAFLSHRTAVKRVLSLFGKPPPPPTPDTYELRHLAPENYDQWLLSYLRQTLLSYTPRPYPGKITLFRSADEPRGIGLDLYMGWKAFAQRGVDVTLISGDHFSVFQQPGVAEMARQVRTLIGASTELTRDPSSRAQTHSEILPARA